MAPDQALKSETQLPFEVDAAVLEQVAEFRRQQQASLELASLELAGPGTTKGPTQIDF